MALSVVAEALADLNRELAADEFVKPLASDRVSGNDALTGHGVTVNMQVRVWPEGSSRIMFMSGRWAGGLLRVVRPRAVGIGLPQLSDPAG
jgi:hypothetical protein